jgi:tetratricopeptide (TPR) repeat protein
MRARQLFFLGALVVVTPLYAFFSDADDYSNKADAYMSSNEPLKAEQAYRDGLRKFPDSFKLQRGLLELYEKTKRWGDFEAYFDLLNPDPYGHNLSYYHKLLGYHYFETEFWSKAAMHLEKAAEYYGVDWIYDPKSHTGCVPGLVVITSYYRDAAAAYKNNDDERYVAKIYKKMQSLVKLFGCNPEKIPALSEVGGWLE